MITITENLWQTFSLEADPVENLTAHAIAGTVLKRDGHGSANAFLNILNWYHGYADFS
jgi:hypothetical protein